MTKGLGTFNRLIATIAVIVTSSVRADAMPKLAPHMTEETVISHFGDRLTSAAREERILLTAIAFDHAAPGSPFHGDRVGIPYITGDGPAIWVQRLAEGKRDIATTVNNGLMLLFLNSSEIEPAQRRLGAIQLFEQAAEAGYWPVNYYLAYALLTRSQVDLEQRRTDLVRAQTLLAQCAEVGFAPCQYSLGFWALEHPSTASQGKEMLTAAIEITRRDERYTKNPFVMQDFKTGLALLAHPDSGVDAKARAEFTATLVQYFM